MTTVNLENHRTPGVGLFAGYDRGEQVRKKENLDALDTQPEPITVHVPEDVFAVTSSFLQGLLTRSIRSLGEEKFREHYRFSGQSIQPTVDVVVGFVLKEKLPL